MKKTKKILMGCNQTKKEQIHPDINNTDKKQFYNERWLAGTPVTVPFDTPNTFNTFNTPQTTTPRVIVFDSPYGEHSVEYACKYEKCGERVPISGMYCQHHIRHDSVISSNTDEKSTSVSQNLVNFITPDSSQITDGSEKIN